MRTYIYPYKGASRSAKDLADASKSRRIKHVGSKFAPGPNKLVINWGSSSMPPQVHQGGPVLNSHAAVKRAGNKLDAFCRMSEEGVVTPSFTSDKDEAEFWVNRKHTVVCRTKLNGYGGDGIVIATTEQELVPAPLYTLYTKKKSEWRVHIFRDEIIMLQRKARRLDVPDDKVNWQVRNHANGFIYEHMEVNPPVQVIEQATAAITALELDFGAVDVIYNDYEEKAYVLEVNCAPGLAGTTLERYAGAVERAKRVLG